MIFRLFDEGEVATAVILLELLVKGDEEAATVVVDVVAFRLFDAALRLTMQQISLYLVKLVPLALEFRRMWHLNIVD